MWESAAESLLTVDRRATWRIAHKTPSGRTGGPGIPSKDISLHRRSARPCPYDNVTQVLPLAALRILVPSPSIHARMQLQDHRFSRTSTVDLGGLILLPFHSLAQTQAAIVRHIRRTTNHRYLSVGRDRRRVSACSLRTCLATPAIKEVKGVKRWEVTIAWVAAADSCSGVSQFRKPLGFEREIWVELDEANQLPVLRALADGKGRLVVRLWRQLSPNRVATHDAKACQKLEGRNGLSRLTLSRLLPEAVEWRRFPVKLPGRLQTPSSS